jgi:trehalose 6-phosphate synthase/phosphatase
MSSGLVIVSNRLPVSVKKVDGKLEFFPSVGGLATGLAHYADDPRNKWIGWPGIPSDGLTEKERQHIAEELKARNCYPVFLTKRQLEDYYNGYCNRLLWPHFHDVKVSKSAWQKQAQYWKAYKRINELFAESVLALSTDGSVIWVHDYQLLLLPALLRSERPDDKIGFFLHIPFPSAASFSKLADGEALIAGMLGAGLIGFHTKGYVENFIAAVERYDMGVALPNDILLANRSVRVLDFPMGIDYAKYAKARRSNEVEQELAKLQAEYIGQKVILTVDRLDPSKGLVERAKAFQALLDQNPRLRRKVTLIMIVVPSRTEIPEYKQLKQKLEKIVQEVNTTYQTATWNPLVYRYEALPFHQVTALYRLADVAFIVPLRDGMNLVAKEYLASNLKGVLVLSQTAGAAQELKEAVMVDPAEQDSVVLGLKRALITPTQEFQRHLRHMQRHLRIANVQSWAGGFMSSLRETTQLAPRRFVTAALTAVRQELLAKGFAAAERPLLLLDYDGVLVGFYRNPEDAKPSKRLKKLLAQLSKRAQVVIISGRKRSDLDRWLGDLPISLVAEHGMYTKRHGTTTWRTTPHETPKNWRGLVQPILEKYAARAPGAQVEAKESSLVWHFRKTSPYHAQKYLIVLKRALKAYARKSNLELRQGNKILEVRPHGINKGTSAIAWLNKLSPDFVVAIGDDYTDEDMFTNLSTDAYTIKVGRGRTAAKYRLKNVESVLAFLEQLVKK